MPEAGKIAAGIFFPFKFLFIDERRKDINLLFHLFMHSWLNLACAPTGIKPATLVCQGDALTN